MRENGWEDERLTTQVQRWPAAALQSRGADGQRLATPHLTVKYATPQESRFWKE